METNAVDIINNEGFLFQKYCVEMIKEAGWKIEMEEYPISEKGSFDIKASIITFDVVREIAVVECKRQDPQRKRWIFFRKDSLSSSSNPFWVQVHGLTRMERSFPRKSKVFRNVADDLNVKKLEFPSCHTTGVVVYKDEKKSAQWKTDTEVVYKAALSVAKGVNYLFDLEARNMQRTLDIGIRRLEKWKKLYGDHYLYPGTLIPIVITSAPLFSVGLEPDQMNTDTFKVDYEKLDYLPMKWLIYEFPLLQELRYENKEVFKLSGENRYAKMHIFIVNAMKIKEFFQCLEESLKNPGGNGGRFLSPEFRETYRPKRKT